MIPVSIAHALQLELRGQEDPLAQVSRHLLKREVLLVLDNYEHLLEGATVASELLRHCPHLKLLVTSRERLNVAEEWLLPVAGMSFPTDQAATFEEALASDAVQLFVQRAERVQPGFALTAENWRNVLRICRLVQGFPLALELAAAWVRIMSSADVASEIAQNLDFLITSTRNVPEKHKSIRAVFEHSWKLLAPKEQELLARLSVFRGGFQKEAAAVVAGASMATSAS